MLAIVFHAFITSHFGCSPRRSNTASRRNKLVLRALGNDLEIRTVLEKSCLSQTSPVCMDILLLIAPEHVLKKTIRSCTATRETVTPSFFWEQGGHTFVWCISIRERFGWEYLGYLRLVNGEGKFHVARRLGGRRALAGE